ncbi:hypothetical protein PI87_19110 [Ralstonia sp. A12]|uniref:type II secretion system minor pseudopilin GspK n=1 Tax=Ralstonia sp. A12 TaxID=1217052 RepID=UPI000574035A|nr:type II secretion system minor pseudopilin GspK [Ralstonia sp. A12]KHK52896.1 hypothetical protein PI87_19110 [Ralstonia sp. A12]
MKRKRMRRERGAAVVTALLVVAMAVTLVATMFAGQKAAIRKVEVQRLRADTVWMQRASVEWARMLLRENARTAPADHLGQRWAAPVNDLPVAGVLGKTGLQAFDAAGDMRIDGYIEDAQARFNLNTLVTAAEGGKPPGIRPEGVRVYQQLLVKADLDPSLAVLTATAILRSLDAKASSAFALAQPEDLVRIPGYTADGVRKLAPYVVVLPEPTSINLNTAGAEVLAATIHGLSPGQAAALVSSRDRAWFRDMGDLTNRLKAIAPGLAEQGDILLETRSRYFIAHSRLRNGRATRSLDALILREGIGERYRTSVLWVHEPAMPGIDG